MADWDGPVQKTLRGGEARSGERGDGRSQFLLRKL